MPGRTEVSFNEETALRVYDIFFVGFWVLWFAQILRHLAATNPDRYLSHYGACSDGRGREPERHPRPGAWTASALERRLDWPLTEAEEMQEAVMPQPESLGRIWRELIPEGGEWRRSRLARRGVERALE